MELKLETPTHTANRLPKQEFSGVLQDPIIGVSKSIAPAPNLTDCLFL